MMSLFSRSYAKHQASCLGIIILLMLQPAYGIEWPESIKGLFATKPVEAAKTITWTRKEAGASSVVIFIHGVLGDSRTTWTNSITGKSWPELIAKDPALPGFDLLVFGFESSLKGKNQSPSDLAGMLKIRLQKEGIYENYRSIVFVAHSMGGLVVREFLNRYSPVLGLAGKVPMLYLVSVPSNGSGVANAAGALYKSQQLVALGRLPDNLWLESNQQNWIANPLSRVTKTYCATETESTYGLLIVPRESALPFCTETLTAVRRNHIDIAKPASVEDDIYVALQVALQEALLKSKKVVLESASLPVLIAQLRAGFPLTSYVVRGQLDAEPLLADQDLWTVADLEFEPGAVLRIGQKSLTLDVKGKLNPSAKDQEIVHSFVPHLRAPSPSTSLKPAKPATKGPGNAGQGEGGSGGTGLEGDSGVGGVPGKSSGNLSLIVRQVPTRAFRVALVGQHGGPGGDGGDGGPGGPGTKGTAGRSNTFDCAAGGGAGGNGGSGGAGGSPGLGGSAGAGGTLTIIHPITLSNDLARQFAIEQSQAERGSLGQPGAGGPGGRHGDGGNGSGNCSGGPPGSPGAAGSTGAPPSDNRLLRGDAPKVQFRPLTAQV